jgi:hypothetical protein
MSVFRAQTKHVPLTVMAVSRRMVVDGDFATKREAYYVAKSGSSSSAFASFRSTVSQCSVATIECRQRHYFGSI